MSVIDLEDLLEDITVYLELEKGKNQDYWRDITTITEDQLAQARRLQPTSYGEGSSYLFTTHCVIGNRLILKK